MSKRRANRHYKHDRRSRFLTLLGSLIIFATFVVKEGISENLRDLVSSIDTAENLYIMRDDMLQRTNTHIESAKEPEKSNFRDITTYIVHWNSEARAELEVSFDLAKVLPNVT